MAVDVSDSNNNIHPSFWDHLTRPRPYILIALIVIGLILEFGIHYYENVFVPYYVAYTNFFYIIIVLAGLWYQKKALWVAVFFSAIYLTVEYFPPFTVTAGSLFRVLMLCVVAIVIGNITDRIIVLQNKIVTLQAEMTRKLERLVKERTADLEEEIVQRKVAEQVIRVALAEKEILLKELHHRVSNNLQIIMSMLNLQAKKMKDPTLQLALKESQNRINTISIVQEKIFTSKDLSRINLKAYVRRLVGNLVTLYRVKQETIAVALEIPDIFININTAIPLGLILNELIANSFTHAFPDGRCGEVVLTMRDEGRTLVITCEDNGVGMPHGYDWENPDTLGLMLVHSLVNQLQGTIEKVPVEGTRLTLVLKKSSKDGSSLSGTYNTVPE